MVAKYLLVPFVLAAVTGTSGAAQAQQSTDQLPSGLREAVVEAAYGVVQDGQACCASNPAQKMRSTFTAEDGIRIEGRDAERTWSLELELVAWGRSGAVVPVNAVEPVADGRRVEYRRGSLTEWYVNDAQGLEQGFTIHTRPEGDVPLEIVFAVGSGFRAEISSSGRDAVLTDRATDAVLHYSGLRAWDATRRELSASLSARGRRLSIEVEDEGAVYPLVVDPWIATELAELTASDAAAGDNFGSVAVSGDTAVVGAPLDDHAGGVDAGSAYVFERDQGGPNAWGEVVKLTASDASAGARFGGNVAVSGDTVVVSAANYPSFSGAAYVFERDQGGPEAWGEVAKLTASDGAALDWWGSSVAVSGDTVMIGAPGDDHAGGKDAGSAYVFERDQGGPGAWGEVLKLTASDAEDFEAFGVSVAVSGDTAVVGADQGDTGNAVASGAAYVFERDQGGPNAWGEVLKLKYGLPANQDEFGTAVAISGDTAVVGARRDNNSAGTGAAFVFERDQGGPGAWGQVVKLKHNGLFGWTVDVSSDLAVVGSMTDSAYVYQRDLGGPGSWGEIAQLTGSNDFGAYVAVSGDTALIGAPGGTVSSVGSAYVYGISFASEVYCTAGTSASGCQAGIFASGTASATASSGFVLSASGVEGAKDGAFFWGKNGKQANPWGNGTSFQCVVPPVTRGGSLPGSGTVGACDGSFAQDLNATWCSACPYPQKNPGAGVFVQAQLWYRDPLSTSNQTTSLSDAIEFLVGP